jgi:tetratricopeptide (TPR) repeat protein
MSATPAGVAHEYADRAHRLALAGDLAAAEEAYRSALALAPDVAVRLALATVLLAAGRVDEAEREFRSAWEGGVPAAAAGLALCLRARGAADEARAFAAAALASGADAPGVREVLAEVARGDAPLAPGIAPAGVVYDYAGDRLTFACRACARDWEQAVPSLMCGLDVVCPGCGAGGRLEPEALIAAVVRLDPPLPVPVADAIDRGVAELVERWHREPVFVEALALGGVGVGAAAEHPLFAVVLEAMVAAYRGRAG